MSETKVKYEVIIKKLRDNEFLARLMARNIYPELSKWYIMKQNVFSEEQLLRFVGICKKNHMDIQIRRVE